MICISHDNSMAVAGNGHKAKNRRNLLRRKFYKSMRSTQRQNILTE